MWCRMHKLRSNHIGAKVRPSMEKAEIVASNSFSKESQQPPQVPPPVTRPRPTAAEGTPSSETDFESDPQQTLPMQAQQTLPMQAQPFSRLSQSNFRLACGSLAKGPTKAPAVYRGARPEVMTEPDVCTLKHQLGIRTVVDMRSLKEYRKLSKKSSLDAEYQLYSVRLPLFRNYRHGETVAVQRIHTQHSLNASDPTSSEHKHYLINCFTSYYYLQVFRKAPWYIRLCSVIYFMSYVLWPPGYDYLFQQMVKHVNKAGLLGQYQNIIDMSQTSICAALKLLVQERELPVLVNCAHGKDRTGIVCALVLYCLGHSMEQIAEEYALSEEGLKYRRKQVTAELVDTLHLSQEFACAKAETMELLFRYIVEQYGSVEKYLDHIGFGPAEQEMLRLYSKEKSC